MFLAEKQFEGCDGLVITDEIRVVIAAQACLLLLHRDTDCPTLATARWNRFGSAKYFCRLQLEIHPI